MQVLLFLLDMLTKAWHLRPTPAVTQEIRKPPKGNVIRISPVLPPP